MMVIGYVSIDILLSIPVKKSGVVYYLDINDNSGWCNVLLGCK